MDDREYDSDYANDPIGHLKRRIDRLDGWAGQAELDRQGSEVMNEYVRNIGEIEREYAKTEPDYEGARDFAARKLKEGYRSSGMSDYEADQQLQRDYLAVAHRAVSARRNPGEAIYEIAKNLGYNPDSPEPTQRQRYDWEDLSDADFEKRWKKLEDRGYPGGRI